MHKLLFTLFLASAICLAADDSSAYWQHLQQHPSAEVQKQVERYRQGLCHVDEILVAEEKLLQRQMQTADKQQYVQLGQQLIRNYREQLRMEELRGAQNNVKIPRIRQKLHELEARVLQAGL